MKKPDDIIRTADKNYSVASSRLRGLWRCQPREIFRTSWVLCFFRPGFGGEGKERRGILLYGKNNKEKLENIKPVKLKTKSTILFWNKESVI